MANNAQHYRPRSEGQRDVELNKIENKITFQLYLIKLIT